MGSGTPIYGGRPGTTGRNESKTLGIFAGLTYDITDRFSVSAEGRYQIDRIATYANSNLTIADSIYVPAGTYAAGSKLASDKFRNFTPRVIANFQIDPDLMVYASYSRGVNPSQFNAFLLASTTDSGDRELAAQQGVPLTVQPEKLTNYELGVKGKALNGRLTYTAAGYYAKWRKQITSYSFLLDDGTLFTGVANSGSTDLYGLEAETHLRLGDLVTIDAAGAYTGTDINSFVNPSVTAYSGITDFSGKEMARTSKWSANLGVQLGEDFARDRRCRLVRAGGLQLQVGRLVRPGEPHQDAGPPPGEPAHRPFAREGLDRAVREQRLQQQGLYQHRR
ncbi:TonB-dependent receptor [Novosphingobium sp. ST904]|uniref:TonB-dependent receptor domain-containing protein n=1 Tax=Novosphingobium sp. ST904 TaxID=1684385 RepID=UPI001E53CDCD|nr:TonB-dependent receptor [Novosphingobium sp. ST904]